MVQAGGPANDGPVLWVPGPAERVFLTVDGDEGGCRVEVVQLVQNQAQAHYMEAAWRTILGRFKGVMLS